MRRRRRTDWKPIVLRIECIIIGGLLGAILALLLSEVLPKIIINR